MPEPRDHTEHRGWIETVLRYIPGFRGYLEKEYRRDSDALQREWLTDRLERSKRGLDEFSRELAEAANIDALPKVDQLRGRIDKLCSRIAGAMRGYSGFFDLVDINEQVLDRVYEFDAKLVDRIDKFGEQVEALPGQTETPVQVIKELLDQVQDFQRIWDDREDILKGLD